MPRLLIALCLATLVAGCSKDSPSGPSNSTTTSTTTTTIPAPIWTFSGSGNSVFDMPTYVSRVRIFGHWSGRGTSNFIVHVGGRGVVNEILRDHNPYEGIHLVTGGGVVEVVNSGEIDNWTFTEVR